MADDIANIGGQLRLAGEEEDVARVAEENGITPDQARDLLERFGNFRTTLQREARKLRAEQQSL